MFVKSGLSVKKKALAVAIGCLLSSGASYAQDQGVNDENIEEVVVKGVRASQAKAIDLKRNSANVIDSIVAEDIGKLPDTTITDSLQRVTGVQISRSANEGTSLNIRGMPQVLTTLNGEQFLSPQSITGIQPDYSDIPAGMISGVDVYKSQSANMETGGISGVVDLKTMKPLALKEGWTGSLRMEGAQGSRSRKDMNDDGTQSTRTPDHSVSLIAGFNNGDDFAVYGNLYKASSHAANYSIWDEQRLAFLDTTGGNPKGDLSDPDGLNGYSDDWYIVPTSYGAQSRFMDRDREGGSFSAEYQFNENWSARGDIFYTQMDQFDRSVSAQFNGANTPDAFQKNGESAKYQDALYNVLQPGTEVGAAHPFSFVDSNGVTQTKNLHSLRVAEIWAADFQTTSANEISKTAAINSNFEVHYTNNEDITASARFIHAVAEKQYRKATFQQGTPAWLWVDEDGIPGKDPIDGYHVTVDYTSEIPSFSFADDLSSSDLLKQYQGFAEGANTDAELNVARVDVQWELDGNFAKKLSGGVRYGVREANHNKFFYVSPTGRYTDWEDPRVPADKRYMLLPGNLIWQKYPNWLKFNYAETNSSLIDIGGLVDNGFSAADTMSFTDFGPIKGFENGIAALNPADWDNPYEFMNRLYPGTRTVNDPGYTYGVEEASTNAYIQLDFGNENEGLFGIPYSGNMGFQIVRTDRSVDKTIVPDVLDSFNSIGYDDWQKIAYVSEMENFKNSTTDVLPSANLNLFPTDDVVIRLGYAKTMTRNDLETVGSGPDLWYQRCIKTDENGDPVKVLDPSNGNEVEDTIGCVGGGSDKGDPNIKPWSADVWNASSEWYFAENSILGVGLFLIQVDTAVEEYQEPRNFADSDGINRNRYANIYTTRNVGASDLYGLEMGYKQPFTFLPGDYLSATGIEFNYTYSHSESVEKDLEGNSLPLPSNSKHQSNMILWYDKNGLNVRLAYNWRSAEYTGRGGVNTNATVLNLAKWAEPTGYLDLSVSYWLNDHVSFYANGTNLTEQSRKSYAQFEDQFSSLWVQERRFALGVNLSL